MRTVKDPVYLDKYALYNACLANETTFKELSTKIGHSNNYLSQMFTKGMAMSMGDYENLKGILRVTDNSLVKAIPVERADAVESIYSPRPIKKTKDIPYLSAENEKFIELLAQIVSGDKVNILNGIVNDFRENSAVAGAVGVVVSAIGALTM